MSTKSTRRYYIIQYDRFVTFYDSSNIAEVVISYNEEGQILLPHFFRRTLFRSRCMVFNRMWLRAIKWLRKNMNLTSIILNYVWNGYRYHCNFDKFKFDFAKEHFLQWRFCYYRQNERNLALKFRLHRDSISCLSNCNTREIFTIVANSFYTLFYF